MWWLTFCPSCCLALWCGTLIVLLVQRLLIILGSLYLYNGMSVSTIGLQAIVRLLFVDSVCWSCRQGIFLWCSCVWRSLWLVVRPMCFLWFRVNGLFPIYVTYNVGSVVILWWYVCFWGGIRWHSWLRHCAISRKVAGSFCRWCHWNFLLTLSFRPHYGPGVDSATNINEYQEYFVGVKAAGA